MNIEERVAVSVPGSKSVALRVLIIATFLDSPLQIENLPECDDVKRTVAALLKLGFEVEKGQITPPKEIKNSIEIEVGESAAALRFLAIRFAVWEGLCVKLKIGTQLSRRPIEPLVTLIKAMGGDIKRKGDELVICGKKGLMFNKNHIPYLSAEITSQLLSGLLLSSPAIDIVPYALRQLLDMNEDSGSIDSKKVSQGYARLTHKVMEDFGLDNESEGSRKYINPHLYFIEPDVSSACYFWALGCITKKLIGVKSPNCRSLQPDYCFLEVLQRMGAQVIRQNGVVYVTAEKLKAGAFDMISMPDQVPTLAVLALFIKSQGGLNNREKLSEAKTQQHFPNATIIYNIEHLRYKESDRVSSLVEELIKVGADIRYDNGAMTIKPLAKKSVKAATLDCKNDHRLIMAFSLLQTIYPEIELTNKEGVEKSFPAFFEELTKCVDYFSL